jgi:hypothetical protein
MHLPPFRLPSGARCEASQRSQRRCSQPVPQLKLKRQRSAPDPVRENAIPIFGDADRQLMALFVGFSDPEPTWLVSVNGLRSFPRSPAWYSLCYLRKSSPEPDGKHAAA